MRVRFPFQLLTRAFGGARPGARRWRAVAWGAAVLGIGAALLLALLFAPVWRPVPGLGPLLARQTNQRLMGHASIGSARVRWPLGLELTDVSLRTQAGAPPLVQVTKVRARIAFWPLWRGRLALADVLIDGLYVASGSALDRALMPRTPPSPSKNELPLRERWFARWPFEIRHARIRHASFAGESATGRVSLYGGSAWLSAHGTLQDGTLNVGAEADGLDVTLTRHTASEGLGPIFVQALGVDWHAGPHDTGVAVHQLLGSVSSLTVVAGGSAARQNAGDEVDASIDALVDGAWSNALLRVFPPGAQRLTHRGAASLRTQVAWHGPLGDPWTSGNARVHVEGDGHDFQVGTVKVAHVALDVTLHDGRFSLDDAILKGPAQQTMRAQGSALLSGSASAPRVGPFVVGVEAVAINGHAWLAHAAAPKTLSARGLPRALDAYVHAEGLRAYPDPLLRWDATVRARGLGGLPAHGQPLQLAARGTLSSARATLAQASLTLGTLGTATAAASVPLRRAADPLSASLHARLAAVGPLAQALGSSLGGQQASLDVRVGGSRAHPTASGLLQARALRMATGPARGPLGDLQLPWTLSGHSVSVPGATLRGDGGAARLVAQATIGGGPKDALHASLAIDNLSVPIGEHRQARAFGDLIVAGSPTQPNAYGTLSWHTPQGPRGHALRGALMAEADRSAMRLTGLTAHIGTRGLLWLRGAWITDPGVMHLVARGRDLPLLPAMAGPAVAAVSMPLDVDLEAHGEPHRHMVSSATLRVPRGWLQGEGGYRPPQGRRPLQDGSFDARVRGHGSLAALAPLVPGLAALRPGGEVALALNVDCRDQQPVGTGSLLWQQPKLAGRLLRAGAIDVEVSSVGARRYAVRAHAQDPAALDVRADLTWPRRAAPSAHVQLNALSLGDLYPPLHASQATLTARGSADVRRDVHDGWSGQMHLAQLAAVAADQQLTLQAPADARFGGGMWTLSPLRLQGSAGRLSARANMAKWLNVDIDGRLHLGVLLPFVPSVRHVAGEVAFDMGLRGDCHAPRADAQLTVVSPVHVQPRHMPSELLVSAGRLTLHGDEVRLAQLEGQIEGGTFHIDGQAQWHDYRFGRFAFALLGSRLPLHTGPIVAESNVRLRIDGDGDGDAPHALFKGDIDIVSGRFLRKFELRDFNFLARKPSLEVPLERRAPWLKHIALDVRAKNKSGFDVRVDAGSFAMRSTLESDVHVGGNVLAPLLNGKISASEGSLRFPHGTLLLRMASLDFDPSRRTRANVLGAEVNVLADGEVAPTHAQSAQNFDITLRLDGNLDSITLDLANSQGLAKMDVLALLTTGHANISDLAQGGDDSAKLDAALSIAGSQVAEPMARMAEQLLERRLNLQIELGTEVSQGNVRVTAAKNLHRRLRLETAYSHGLTAEQSNVSTRAQLSFTDRLLLEGRAARDLTGSSTSIGAEHSLQSNLELKLRVLGL